MANEVYTRTNQAMYFARLATDAWADVLAADTLTSVTLGRYHREHVLFHLNRALVSLVHEVADRYRWPLLDVRALDQALNRATVERFPGPELAELNELAEQQDSWLGRLLAAWQQLQAPPKAEESRPPEDNMIASSAQRQERQWELEDAREAQAALAERIACHREGMLEW